MEQSTIEGYELRTGGEPDIHTGPGASLLFLHWSRKNDYSRYNRNYDKTQAAFRQLRGFLVAAAVLVI